MKFRVREGPWRTLFEGTFEEHEVSVYLNSKSVLLVSILEKKGDQVVGAVIEVYKVFSASGEVEDFLETFPKEALLLARHDKKQTNKFFILATPPSYAQYSENAFCDEAEKLMEKLKQDSDMVKDVSRAYDLELTELHKTEPRIRNQFLAEPLSIPILGVRGARARQAGPLKQTFGEVLLGLTKNNVVVREPLSLFHRTLITGPSKEDRVHAMQLLIEGSLMSNAPAVVFDWGTEFTGLDAPSRDLTGLKKFKIENEPIGFPTKSFKAIEDLKVDLNLVNPKGLMQLYGVGENKVSKAIARAMEQGSFESIEGIISKSKKSIEESGLSHYDSYKMVRVLRLIKNSYPELFGGENKIEEVSKNWHKSIGRLGRIDLQGLDARGSLLLVHSIIKGIYQLYEKEGTAKGINSMLVLPKAKNVLPRGHPTIIRKEIIELLNSMKEVGVVSILESERTSDLLAEATEKKEAEMHVISREDVGVKLANRKQYRLALRPGFSAGNKK